MNFDEQRLKEIKEFKIFYRNKIEDAETELEKDLLQVRLDELNDEEQDILKRCIV